MYIQTKGLKMKYIKIILFALFFTLPSHSDVILGDDKFYTYDPFTVFNYDDEIRNTLKNTLGPFYQIVDMCYDFTPPTINDYLPDINLCESLPVLRIDPCKSLPNLSLLGYTKRTMFGRKNFNTKAYCDNFIKSQKVEMRMIEAMKNVNFNVNLLDKDEENMKRGIDLPFETIQKHRGLSKIVSNNDYMSGFVITQIFNNSKSIELDQLNLNEITVEYNTTKDFDDSVKELKENFLMIQDELDIGLLREKSKAAFYKVNKDYPLNDITNNAGQVISELKRNKQKESIKGKLLKSYQTLLEKYHMVLAKRELFLRYRPTVMIPTKASLENYPSDARIRKVYEVELQKLKKAKILEEVTEKITKMKNAAIKAIDKEFSFSREFNSKKALKDIRELTKDH